jgi:putative ABC transport system ATP-binding protein
MPLIEFKKINKIYESGELSFHALKNVSVTIEEGEFVAIMGPSGSGKSTLMNLMGFLDSPSSGTYTFDGEPLTSFDEEALAELRNKRIGFVFQMFYLLPRMSALENVMIPMVYAQKSREHQLRRGKELLEAVELEQVMNNQPNQMSGGQQQRVAIARALANDPKIIFADEPTGNLDTHSGKEVMQILERLNKEGRTIIMVTHEAETAKHAKRIITIRDGEIESDVKRRSSKAVTQKK